MARVFSSRSADAADDLRQQIRKLIEAGESDDAIVDYLVSRNAQILLVPKATGFDALVWFVPTIVFACAVGGLALTFRRWSSRRDPPPSDDDRALVAAALEDEAAQ